jgi:hypothetical protein
MSDDDWSTRRNIDTSFGYAGQKFMVFDFTTNTIHLFKAEGLVASATFENIHRDYLGYTYSDNIAYPDSSSGYDYWYIVDTEDLTVKQIYYGPDICDGNTQVDRIWYTICEGPGYTDLINGSITRIIAGYFPEIALYNDIYRRHD